MREKMFVDSFTESILEHNPCMLSAKSLRTIGSKLFHLLLSFKDDPFSELYDFAKKTLEHDIDIKPIVTKTLLELIRDYTVFILEHKRGIEPLKALMELVELYLLTIDKANAEIMHQLKEELDTSKMKHENSEHELIIHTLKMLYKHNESLTLLTYVNELPISCKVKLNHCSEQYAKFDIGACHHFIFNEQQSYYLKNEHFPKIVTGEYKIDPESMDLVVFSNLCFTELSQEARRYVRTILHDIEPAEIIYDQQVDTAVIHDISVGGMGVRSLRRLENLVDRTIDISFNLLETELKAKGTVRYERSVESGYHYGIEFTPQTDMQDKVAEYVMKRQFEILKELKSNML